MFTMDELKMLASAVVVQEKSVMRLAAKDGQPDSVAAEYRKVASSLTALLRKVVTLQDELAKVGKK